MTIAHDRQIRRRALCVGYTDDFAGYLTDPAARPAKEYAALVVPKIVYLPPFTTETARQFTRDAQSLLKKLAG